jgi:transposase
MGNLLAVVVHAANIHDTISGMIPLSRALKKYPGLKGVCADSGYRGTFKNAVTDSNLQCDISEKIKPKEWEILPKRWRVERTFSWFSHSRRLSKDYEILADTEESICMISHLHTLLKRGAY